MAEFSTALVTGGTGFIGAALVKKLLSSGVRVICPVRPGSPNAARLDDWKGNANLDIIDVPSMDYETLSTALSGRQAEVVFNLASYGVKPTDLDPTAILEGNVGLVDSLLRVAANWPLKRFIHIGTFSEYAPIGPDEAHIPVLEDHPLRPDSLYGAGKASAGIWGHALASRLGVPFVALRMFHVYGPGESDHRLLPFLIDKLIEEQSVDLSPGNQVRDVLYIDDAVQAIIAAATSDSLQEPTYNISTGVGVTIREMGETATKLMNKSFALLNWGGRDYRAGEAMWMVGDNSCFVDNTGWTPNTSLESGIKQTIAARLQARKN